MGDKGGRKDKDKSQKQEARKQKALALDKKAKQPKGPPQGGSKIQDL